MPKYWSRPRGPAANYFFSSVVVVVVVPAAGAIAPSAAGAAAAGAIAAESAVMVVNADSALERRTVILGLETPDRVEVKSGLKEGDLVVVGNRSQLKAGQKVDAKGRG